MFEYNQTLLTNICVKRGRTTTSPDSDTESDPSTDSSQTLSFGPEELGQTGQVREYNRVLEKKHRFELVQPPNVDGEDKTCDQGSTQRRAPKRKAPSGLLNPSFKSARVANSVLSGLECGDMDRAVSTPNIYWSSTGCKHGASAVEDRLRALEQKLDKFHEDPGADDHLYA